MKMSRKQLKKIEKSKTIVEEDEDAKIDDDDESAKEEAIFIAMEKDQEMEDAAHPLSQPKAVEAAPKLLQSALEKGEVQADDSESDDDKKNELQQQQPSNGPQVDAGLVI